MSTAAKRAERERERERRAELAGGIDRAEEQLLELQRTVARLRGDAAELRTNGLVALDLERALVSIAAVSRALQRAYHGAIA